MIQKNDKCAGSTIENVTHITPVSYSSGLVFSLVNVSPTAVAPHRYFRLGNQLSWGRMTFSFAFLLGGVVYLDSRPSWFPDRNRVVSHLLSSW